MRLHEVIWPNKYMLTSVGLWPSTNSRTGFFIYLRFVAGLFAMMNFFVAQLMTVVANWGDIRVLGDYGSLALVHLLVSLKIVYFFSTRRRFGKIYRHIEEFWEISDDPRERVHFERLAKIAKMVTIVFVMAAIGNVLSFEAVALINLLKNRREMNESLRHRPLPMELCYGFDTQQSPTYELLFVWQSLCMFCAVGPIIGCDSTIMVFILHACGQYKLISHRFRTIGRKISEKTISNDKLHADIGNCVAQHQHAIRVTKELSSLLSPVIFAQIVSSGLQICLGGYSVIKGDSSVVEIFKFLVLFASLLLQLVIFCAPAELLIQESTAIAETIYCEVPWFELSPSLRRDLDLVMMRAQRGCHVTALYQVMSVCKITEVCNAAGSYMALLNSVKQ